jgi:DNA gyrase inhibitor GyrI
MPKAAGCRWRRPKPPAERDMGSHTLRGGRYAVARQRHGRGMNEAMLARLFEPYFTTGSWAGNRARARHV